MTDVEAVSVRLDGRASVEHQIEIHVIDLVEAIDNKDITVLDILQGLKYVSDYRISGGKMPNLSQELMVKLAKGLLEQTHKKKGNLLNQKPTEEADLAFSLICDFIANVSEFRKVIGTYNAVELKNRLKIHRRIQSRSTEEERIMAATLLGLLTLRFPQFKDWKELVEEDEHDEVEKLMKAYPEKFNTPIIPIADTIYPPPALYFDKNSEALVAMYQSDLQKGLTTEQVVNYRNNYGVNSLPPPKETSVFMMVLTQLKDLMVIILIVVALGELFMDGLKEAIVLLTVVVINVAIGATQEYNANKALGALLTLTVAKASVIRDGKQSTVDATELVPGDIVVLEEGEAVPADLRLCEVAQLDVIESILTGESLPVSKSVRTIRQKTRKLPLAECKGNAFMTTVVSRGRGKGVVVRTGINTEIGKISAAISSATNMRTNIEIKLSQLGMWLVAIALLLVVLIVVIGILWKRPPLEMVQVGISLGVSVIPEGLVAVVTISMALGVQRMAKLNAIVRKLPSVETVGSVTVICSDKTGTLTEGKMGAQRIWTSDNALFTISHSTSLDPSKGEINRISSTSIDNAIEENQLSATHKPIEVSKHIQSIPGNLVASLMVCSLCNNSGVNKNEEGKWFSVGDPTEVAMLVAGYKGGLGREWFMNELHLTKLGEYAFDSDRKMMSSLFATSEKSPDVLGSRVFVLAKGAPESIMKHCTHYLAPSESSSTGLNYLSQCPRTPLNEQFVEYLSKQSAEMANSGLRVLALAVRNVSLDEGNEIVKANKSKAAESDLTFAGLIGLIDPPKQGVKDSIAISKAAGIKVIMITGDHIATASAIAKDLGIIDSSNHEQQRAMKGYEIDLLSEEQLAEQKPFPVVFARVSPDNKLKIVKALQRKNQSVVMTGDGVNDAPAIKQANVGVAMGIAGTEITKQAADIILANDDFTTIVHAVKEGRQVYDNILKFVVYLLSCNCAEVLLFLTCVSCNLALPFTTIQILWANIFADIPPALSLGLEPPEPDLMERNPRPTKQNVLTASSISVILSQAIIMTAITFTVYFLTLTYGFAGITDLVVQRSLAFILLSTLQLVQSFLSRSILTSTFKIGFFGNKILVYAFIIAYGCMLIGLEVPPIANWLELKEIGPIGWAIIAVCLVIHVILVELAKFIIRIIFKDEVSQSNHHNGDIKMVMIESREGL